MTLEQIYALSPTIAALALVLSLIYASLQFRINTKVARNARLIAAAAVFQDFSRLLASNAECARIFRDGLNDLAKLDPVERWRFGSMMQMLRIRSWLWNSRALGTKTISILDRCNRSCEGQVRANGGRANARCIHPPRLPPWRQFLVPLMRKLKAKRPPGQKTVRLTQMTREPVGRISRA